MTTIISHFKVKYEKMLSYKSKIQNIGFLWKERTNTNKYL